MKYIRTKDERIGTSWEIASKPNIISFGQPHKFRQEISKDNVLKQADTIEELCDEFIIKHNYNTVLPYEIVNSLKPIINGMKVYIDEFKKSDVYGAIWTDKGLIYVAKLKGVLPNGEIDWELL